MAGDVDEAEISPDGTQIALMLAAAPPPGGKPVQAGLRGPFHVGVTSTAAVFDLVSYGVSGAPITLRFCAPVDVVERAVRGVHVGRQQRALGCSYTDRPQRVDARAADCPRHHAKPQLRHASARCPVGASERGGHQHVRRRHQHRCRHASGRAVLDHRQRLRRCAAPWRYVRRDDRVHPDGSGGRELVGDVSRATDLSVSASLVGAGESPSLPTPGSLTISPGSANYGTGRGGHIASCQDVHRDESGSDGGHDWRHRTERGGADQFAIGTNTCTGSLGPGASCTIDVSATVTRDGAMSATLGIVGTAGEAAQATLRIRGTAPLFTPELLMNPGVVSAGEVTVAVGSGFPPNITVELAFHDEPPFATVQTDAAGAFRYNFLVLRNGIRIGGREVIADRSAAVLRSVRTATDRPGHVPPCRFQQPGLHQRNPSDGQPRRLMRL